MTDRGLYMMTVRVLYMMTVRVLYMTYRGLYICLIEGYI